VPSENRHTASSSSKLFLQLSFCKEVVGKNLTVALVVGTLLTLINQGGELLRADWQAFSAWKAALTFIVPFLVSTYSAAKAMMRFRVGEPAPVSGEVECQNCHKTHRHFHRGEPVTACDLCDEETRWKLTRRD